MYFKVSQRGLCFSFAWICRIHPSIPSPSSIALRARHLWSELTFSPLPRFLSLASRSPVRDQRKISFRFVEESDYSRRSDASLCSIVRVRTRSYTRDSNVGRNPLEMSRGTAVHQMYCVLWSCRYIGEKKTRTYSLTGFTYFYNRSNRGNVGQWFSSDDEASDNCYGNRKAIGSVRRMEKTGKQTSSIILRQVLQFVLKSRRCPDN